MGATFSHLAQSLRHPNGGVGRALCLNTLGGALAPLFFGVYLLPKIGLQSVLWATAVSYLLCIPRFHRPIVAAALGLTAVALWLGGPAGPNRLISLAEGDTIISHREGVMASVSVVKDSRDQLHLKVNNRFQMGGDGLGLFRPAPGPAAVAAPSGTGGRRYFWGWAAGSHSRRRMFSPSATP